MCCDECVPVHFRFGVGRLWQTLILSRWKPLFALVPVESLIREQQAGYYDALNESSQAGASTPFIAHMRQVIHDTLAAIDSGTEQVTEQVRRLLGVMKAKPASANELMTRLRLRHRPNFTATYLNPALAAGLNAMRRPDAPRSSRQQYQLTNLAAPSSPGSLRHGWTCTDSPQPFLK